MKLNKIDAMISQRKLVFYNKLFKNNENITIVNNNESTFNYYSIIINNGSRDELQKYLTEAGISTAIYYPKTLSLPAHILNKAFLMLNFYLKKLLRYQFSFNTKVTTRVCCSRDLFLLESI